MIYLEKCLQWLHAQQNVHFSNLHPKPRISLCQISKQQLSSKLKSFSNQAFPIENANLPKSNCISWKTLVPLWWELGRLFKWHSVAEWPWNLSPYPPGIQKTWQAKDAFRTFPHPPQRTCGQLGVSLGCTAPDSSLLVKIHYVSMYQTEELPAWHNTGYHRVLTAGARQARQQPQLEPTSLILCLLVLQHLWG